MIRAITKNARSFVALIALIVVAGVVGIYILQEQRLRIPFIDPAPVRYNVELANAQAVTPGQGQTAQVSGVEIGAIADVELEEGVAVVGLDIEPEYEDLMRQGSRALLRPRTGLKDMYIQIFPGEGEQMPEGSSIRLDNTLTDVDLDEILAQLDDRTRNYLDLFINGAGRGVEGRGNDIARVFERYAPTVEDLALVNRAVAREREALSSTVTSLAQISDRLADRPEDLTQVVDAGARALGAFAAEEQDLRATVSELAPTLDVTEQTLVALRPFSRELGPTLDSLGPAVRALDEANDEVRPFAREATPIVRDEIRPFVREAQPLVEDLAPTAQALSEAFPEVTAAGEEFNKFLNLLAFNPDGREGADVAGREEGYLFWLAWVGHQGVNLHNSDDGNGVLRPVFLTGTCDTLANLVEGEPALESLMNLTPILLEVCDGEAAVADLPSVDLGEALTQLGLTAEGRPAQSREDLGIAEAIEDVEGRLGRPIEDEDPEAEVAGE